MKIGDRLRKRRKELGYTVEKVAELCDWPTGGRVSHYENGRRQAGLDDIEILAKALQTTSSWIAYGMELAGYMYEGTEEQCLKQAQATGLIPVLPWEHAIKWKEGKDKATTKAKTYIPYYDKFYEDLFALEAKNDFMSTNTIDFSYKEGDLLLIRSINPENEDIVLVRLDGDENPVFKKYRKEGGVIYFMSINSVIPPRESTINDCIIGVLFEKIPKSIRYKSNIK